MARSSREGAPGVAPLRMSLAHFKPYQSALRKIVGPSDGILSPRIRTRHTLIPRPAWCL